MTITHKTFPDTPDPRLASLARVIANLNTCIHSRNAGNPPGAALSSQAQKHPVGNKQNTLRPDQVAREYEGQV